MCACVREARVALAGWMALTGGMADWVGWLAGCVVAVLARCLRAGLVDWRVGCHAQLTQYLSDGRGGRPTRRRRPSIAAVSQSKLRRRCARTVARTSVSAMMPQRGAVVWNPLSNFTSLFYTNQYIQVWRQLGVAISVLRCVALCCGVVWCGVLCCRVLPCVVVWCALLCCDVLRRGVVRCAVI